MRRPDLPAGSGLALAVLAVLVVIAVVGERSSGGGKPVAPSLVALSPLDGRSPSEPAGSERRVLVELSRPALAERSDLEQMSAEDQRDYVASLKREARALRSALGARGVALRDVVAFGRTWDGFAATVDTVDLAALSSLGVRAQPVRRFYPAASEPVPLPAAAARAARGGAKSGGSKSGGGKAGASASPGSPPAAAPPADQAPVAVLDTGADAGVAALRDRSGPGYDALDRDHDPSPGTDPRAPRRRETTGTALAGIVATAGERVMPIRVAGFGAEGAEVHATTDTLLLGLERAVDPDGDGSTDDAVRVALVGVNAPYAGFGDTPEAQAARGAAKLGTLVVAPAGNEGPARPPNGVIGSPGAARAALTSGASEAGAGAARVEVTVGDRELRDAAVLGGAPSGSAALAGPVTAVDPAKLLAGGQRVTGRVALVRAGANPVAQAAAAAGAGARAVLLAEPRRRALPLMPAGRAAAPVIGLTGDAAKAALAAKAGAKVKFGRVTADRPKGGAVPASGTPSGGTPSGGTPSGGTSGGTPSGGTSGGTPSGGTSSGGTPSPGAAPGASAPAPYSSRGPALDGTPKPDLLAPGAAVAPLPGGGEGLVAGTAVAAARVAVDAARLARERPAETAANLRAAIAPTQSAEGRGAAPAPPVPLGPLQLVRQQNEVVGVRFPLGAFERGDPLAGGSRLEPASRLELELLDEQGTVEQRLTPPGGALDLLPAEYAYTLPAKALARLAPGAYRFRATARAPRAPHSTRARSPRFTVR